MNCLYRILSDLVHFVVLMFYLKQFYFDTVVFEADQLEFLIKKYGADHILLGTDYPYDMGETDPIGLLKKVTDLSKEDFTKVRSGNAIELLNLK